MIKPNVDIKDIALIAESMNDFSLNKPEPKEGDDKFPGLEQVAADTYDNDDAPGDAPDGLDMNAGVDGVEEDEGTSIVISQALLEQLINAIADLKREEPDGAADNEEYVDIVAVLSEKLAGMCDKTGAGAGAEGEEAMPCELTSNDFDEIMAAIEPEKDDANSGGNGGGNIENLNGGGASPGEPEKKDGDEKEDKEDKEDKEEVEESVAAAIKPLNEEIKPKAKASLVDAAVNVIKAISKINVKLTDTKNADMLKLEGTDQDAKTIADNLNLVLGSEKWLSTRSAKRLACYKECKIVKNETSADTYVLFLRG